MYLRLTLLCLLLICPRVYAQTNSTTDYEDGSSQDNPQETTDQIILEPNVVQIILNDEHRSGVDWGAIVSDFHTVSLKKEDNPIWEDKKYRLSFGTVSQDDYVVLLDALDTVGEMSQFVQKPIKTVVDYPVSASFEGLNIRLEAVFSKLKSGDISLHMEPHMALPTIEIRNGQKTATSLLLKSQTDMVVKNNTTVVIGSLIKEEEITKTHKFPLLGDIPLVGLVFRSQGRLMKKTETVIFLTVHINASSS